MKIYCLVLGVAVAAFLLGVVYCVHCPGPYDQAAFISVHPEGPLVMIHPNVDSYDERVVSSIKDIRQFLKETE